MTPREFLAGDERLIAVFDRVLNVVSSVGQVDVRVSKSQIALRRRVGFAYLWRPGQYLSHSHADLVLSIVLGRHEPSPRFKAVVHPTARHWMHHLEVNSISEIDDEVGVWLHEAADRAG